MGIFPRGKKDDPRREQIKEINKSLALLDDQKTLFSSILEIGFSIPREIFQRM